MAYTQSVVYDRSGGRGKRSGVAVAVLTAALFVIGPTIASFIPKCMAGALLLHVGFDLFLEGVYDTIGKCDRHLKPQLPRSCPMHGGCLTEPLPLLKF